MTRTATLAALGTLIALGACGTRADDTALSLARGLVAGAFGSQDTPATAPVDARAVLSRDLINQTGVPLILVQLGGSTTASTMTVIASNGMDQTWQGGDDITLTLSREGVLRTTHGLPYNRHASDVDEVRAALRNRTSGPARRVHVGVLATLEEDRQSYACTLWFSAPETLDIFGERRRLTPVVEACRADADGPDFENRYWIDSAGLSWVSEQWLGPETGHLRLERLHR